MPVQGPLNHVDLTIVDPARSIPFYAAFFEVLGYRRVNVELDEFQGPNPSRASWSTEYASGAMFGVEVRPALGGGRERLHDRYSPGLHHMAFHAESREAVDRIHAILAAKGLTVLDPPAEYASYSKGYYAVFFSDPDGLKLEVVYEPMANAVL